MAGPRFTDPAHFSKHPRLEYGFMACAVIAQVMTLAATTECLTHMDQLTEDFGTPDSMRPWFMASFGLSVGTTILLSGRYGDVFGIRRVLLGGYAWAVLWSLLCGIAYYSRHLGADFYICARAFQGIGPAFVLPNMIGAVGRVYTPGTTRKKVVVGLIGLSAPLGGWLGNIMSGTIAAKTGRWDWNYYAYAITCAIGGVLAYLCVPELKPIRNHDGTKQDLDFVGSVLGIGGMTLFNFVWNEAPVVGWQSAYIITLQCVSVVMLAAFVIWELKYARGPLIPHEVLGKPRLLTILLIMFLAWGAFGINLYHCFTLMIDFRGYSPFVAGAAISPAPVSGAVAAITCSLIVSERTTEYLFFFATLVFTAMSITLATAGIDQTYWRNTFGVWIIGPWGMETSIVNAIYILSENLPPHLQGCAGSLVTVAMNYGIATGLGFAGLVEEQIGLSGDTWRAWRGAMYFSIGIAGLSSVLAFMFLCQKLWLEKTHPDELKEEHMGLHTVQSFAEPTEETSRRPSGDGSDKAVDEVVQASTIGPGHMNNLSKVPIAV